MAAPTETSFFALATRYPDEASAIRYFTEARWPDGPYCNKCGSVDVYDCRARRRLPLHKCRDCGNQFTVTSGTVMDNTKLPLQKWLWAFHLVGGARKGLSAHYIARQLGITVRSAWHLVHRIRKCMTRDGEKFTGIVETDEMYWGGRRKGMGRGYRKNKTAVQGIVRRSRFPGVEPGSVRFIPIDAAENVDGRTVGAKLRKYTVPEKTRLMTDESPIYNEVGKSFKSHERVHHKKENYARVDPKSGRLITTNTAEGAFGNLKRQLHGTHHSTSKEHLHRYLSEHEFKYNTSDQTDTERTEAAVGSMEGERLTLFRSRRGGDSLHKRRVDERTKHGTMRGQHSKRKRRSRFDGDIE